MMLGSSRKRPLLPIATSVCSLWIVSALVLSSSALSAQDKAAPAKSPAPAAKADAAEPSAETKKESSAWIATVTLPITDQTASRAIRFATKVLEKARVESAQPVLIFEFRVPPDQKDHGRGSDFSAAFKLASFLSGDKLRGSGGDLGAATTVAFVPQSIEGHAVLAVMACDKILMAPDAELGPAGVDERIITPTIRSAYQEIAGHRKAIPAAVAVKLVDASKELLEVNTDIDQRYILQDELQELKKHRTISSSRVLRAAGQPGSFSGLEARNMGMVGRLVTDRSGLAQALELAPEAIREDLLLSGDLRAIRVDLKGRIKADVADQVIRLISEARTKKDANFVCLWIDSPGGSPADCIRLANFLVGLDPAQVYTVAFIPSEALCDAALVAMGCNQVVMRPQATLGGEGEHVFTDDELQLIRETVREEIAPKRSRSWSLWVAMLDAKLEVFRYTREGDANGTNYYLSAEEAETLAQKQPDLGRWRRGEEVTRPNQAFSADGAKAVEYRLANATVADFAGFKHHFSLEDDPALVEPGWADFLVEALASSGVAVLLLVIGGAALYAELHAPGIGVGAFIAAVCFALFFWSRFLGGTAGWLEVILFVAGLCCLLVEVFVLPGFGIFGLGGGALIIASLVLASQTFLIPHNSYQFAQMQRTLLMLAGATTGIVAAMVLMTRYLPKTPLLGRMVLQPPTEEEAQTIARHEALVDYHELLGMRGTTTTQLVPSGKALIANRPVDVMTEGDFIPRGVRVEVVEVHGNRIVVREVD